MPRPPRVQIAGGIYHVTTRGVARQEIFRDELDRRAFCATLQRMVERHHVVCHAICLMENHYHLVVETREANLSRSIHQLNGIVARRFNARYDRVGHLFQGRFHSELVDSDLYFLELCRYVVLNPVRAGLCRLPEQWPWSSYRPTAGYEREPPFLHTARILAYFGLDLTRARSRYRQFVADAPRHPNT